MQNKHFPSAPVAKGVGYPVYLSPIVGSGERICIAAVCKFSGEQFQVYRAFDIVTCALPKKLCDLIDSSINRVTEHLMTENEINEIPRLMAGLYVGETIEGTFHDCDMISRTVLRNHSMLYVIK